MYKRSQEIEKRKTATLFASLAEELKTTEDILTRKISEYKSFASLCENSLEPAAEF